MEVNLLAFQEGWRLDMCLCAAQDCISCITAWNPKVNSIVYQDTVLFLFSFMLLKLLADVLAVTTLAEGSWDCKCSSQSD